MKSKLIIVGGFLGAGKTSLLWEGAAQLKAAGNKVGLITNDQAANLVDTTFLDANSNLVKEVNGSCFCCNFKGFSDAISYISNQNNGGVIIAEPVGSCTDLSATLMQPIKDKHRDSIDLAPLTVLADPIKLKEVLDGAVSKALYIIEKQFEEADIILINKTDLLSPDELATLKKRTEEKWADTVVMLACVKTGQGINEWISKVLSSTAAGTKIAEVDYDIYADGEAAFGWLNASFQIERFAEASESTASDFLMSLSRRFDNKKVNVGHVKFLLQLNTCQIVGNLTGDIKTASLRKSKVRANSDINTTGATLTVNARVEMPPDELQDIVLQEVDKAFSRYSCKQTALKCLIPGRPNPTYRYSTVC